MSDHMTGPKNPLHLLRTSIPATQAEMAEHMGLPLRTYEDIEAGRSRVRPIHMKAAAYACVTIRDERTLGPAAKAA